MSWDNSARVRTVEFVCTECCKISYFGLSRSDHSRSSPGLKYHISLLRGRSMATGLFISGQHSNLLISIYQLFLEQLVVLICFHIWENDTNVLCWWRISWHICQYFCHCHIRARSLYSMVKESSDMTKRVPTWIFFIFQFFYLSLGHRFVMNK